MRYPKINEEWVVDPCDELTVEEFAIPKGFVKVADCVLNTIENFPWPLKKNGERYKTHRKVIDGEDYDKILVDYIPIKGMDNYFANNKGMCYIIAFDGKVVKIGMTKGSLQYRMGSYACGCRAYMKGNGKELKGGTPATTNVHLMEACYGAIRNGVKVELYGYDIEIPTIEVSIFDETKKIEIPEIACNWEEALLDIYKEIKGSRPVLSTNG